MTHFNTTLQSLLDDATLFLREKGITAARRDARLLLAHVLQCSEEKLLRHTLLSLSLEVVQHYQDLLHAYGEGIPLSRLRGMREFWSLPFMLSPDTLDPRPDSETLVEAVLSAIPDKDAVLHLLDLGTGSGCLLLALLSELPNAVGVGVDISAGAIVTAQKNAQALGLEKRSFFVEGSWEKPQDLLAHIKKRAGVAGAGFDWVVSNPPYISVEDYAYLDSAVKNHDPYRALVGGEDGLACYRVIVKNISLFLKHQGHMALEIGKGQAEAIQALFSNFRHVESSQNFVVETSDEDDQESSVLRGVHVQSHRDLAGTIRVLIFS